MGKSRRACVVVLLLSAAAWGQDRPAPDREPPAIRPSTDQPSDQRPKDVAPPAEKAESARAVPGLEDADHRLKAPALLREGSFIVRRRGSMVKLPSGGWALVYHKDEKGVAERPMVLVPSQTLQRMEQSVGEDAAASVFSVSGEVFVYRGVNYLLPTAAALESSARAEEPERAKPAAAAGSPEVQELIARLEAQRDRPRTIDPAVRSRPAEEESVGGARAGVIPEGRAVVRRSGRMVRTAGGDWSLVFDAGTAGEPAVDRPLLLAPCLALQQMEGFAAREGDAQVLEVSGRVLVYQGKNYLIPTLFQARARGELRARP